MNRELFFTTLAPKLTAADLSNVQDAYWMAKEGHRPQVRRLTGERYVNHVIRVTWIAAVDFGYCDKDTIVTGLLHDTIEDTWVPQGIIVNAFGQRVYRGMLALSKEIPSVNQITGEVISRAKLSTDAYYEKLMNEELFIRVVKVADRIDNLTDLPTWEPARREKYTIETEKYVLPLARKTDLRMAAKIEEKLAA